MMASNGWPCLWKLCLCAVLLSIWDCSTLQCTYALLPPNPLSCNTTGCTLQNSYGPWNDRKLCRVSGVIYPTTEEELRVAVAHATKSNINIKVVSRFSHTIPKLACPATSSGSSILISTERYNSNIEINTAALSVKVDAGVGLRELVDRVEEAGLSLVAAPYWEGVSVGGMICTGAHGSSWWGNGGAVHDHVIGITLVVPAKASENYAKVIRLEPHDPLLNAAKLSLGVLGAISQVEFSLEEAFKRRITYNFTDDAHFEDEFMVLAKRHEFGDIDWYPSRHTAVYRYDDRVALSRSGDGVNDFLGFQPNSILVSESVRAAEKALEKAHNSKGKCILATTTLSYKKLIANGLKNTIIFTGYPVVGHQRRMQTSGSCLYTTSKTDSCAWDPRFKGLFFYETTAIFPFAVFRDFITDVKKLRDLEPEKFCGVDIYNGFLVRFIKASDAYLGQKEDSVVVDFNYYRADDASTPRLNQDVWEEVEQMAFFKYKAKPHWGKNRNIAFLGVEHKYPNFNKFIEAKRKLDPGNIFSSEWSDEVLYRKDAEGLGEGCALEGQCRCSEDKHCSPSKGYFCRPGLVYGEARVCRYSQSQPSSMV